MLLDAISMILILFGFFFFLIPLPYLQWNYYSVSTVYKEGDSGLTFNLSFFTWRRMHVCMYSISNFTIYLNVLHILC